MRTRILNTALLAFLMLVLLLPGINMLTGIVESGKLMGSVTLAGNTTISAGSWFDGSYQQQKEKYINDNIGFRPDLVRVTNQIDHLAFGKLHQEDVILGEDRYLHSANYAKALNGDDFLGRDSIGRMMHKLRFISDTLSRAGKPLIFAFVPSKARIYPETLPKRFRKPPTHETNYEVMLQQCREWGIRSIDFNGWYRNIRATSPHRLFTRQGIHWTRISADHAADSFNRYLEGILHKDLPDMKFGEVRCGEKPENGEDDIAQALNLIWPLAKDTFCYNDIAWNYDTSSMHRPKVIFIADSFFWTWIYDGVPGHAYDGWEYWYYFHERWNQAAIAGESEMKNLRDLDWMGSIDQSDALVLFFTEVNLTNPCLGEFINEAYTRFGGR